MTSKVTFKDARGRSLRVGDSVIYHGVLYWIRAFVSVHYPKTRGLPERDTVMAHLAGGLYLPPNALTRAIPEGEKVAA